MTTTTRIGRWLPFALALALAPGCSPEKSPTATHPAGPVVDLNAPNGGLTPSNERPAFGDGGLLHAAGQERAVVDPVASRPDVRALENLPGTRFYAVTITWGMLEEDALGIGLRDGDAVDWSGGVALSRGAVLVRSLISFEPEDSLVRPRPDPRHVGWISHTAAGLDGIRLLVYAPPDSAGPDTLVFTAGTYTRTFVTTELADLNEMVPVGDAGNQIHFQAFAADPHARLRGFLRGRWEPIAPGAQSAVFAGVWVSRFGDIAGFVEGEYGINDEGRRVFFGKYVDPDGGFVGILGGEWGISPNEHGPRPGQIGWFRGHWVDDAFQEQGTLHGRWRTNKDRPGYFGGSWCLGCTNDPIWPRE